MSRVRALIFDFDGLLVDTEGPYFAAWQDVYAARGETLSPDVLPRWIGTSGFDPVAHLGERIGEELDPREIRAEQRERFDGRMAEVVLRPGVPDYLRDARELGLGVGVASNSTHEWVDGFLARVGLEETFDVVSCRDDVGVHKPDPGVYLHALDELGVMASEAVALEDSPMGIASAKAAGIVCVAVPTSLTRDLSLHEADLVVPSLADVPLRELLERLDGQAPSAS